jgi:hypothetical protein
MNSNSTTAPEIIEKEKVSQLEFPADEVLNDAEAIVARKRELERALALGNLEHVKVAIVFEDAHGVKIVETTVWGVTDKRVILKGGVVLPINRVHKVS